jgi:cytochrome b subunit of formate dehydrogenase
LPAKDERSPVYLGNQVRTCGSCHAEDLKTYAENPHGRGLFQAGLKTTAVCADCHGAHDTYYAADKRSTLHPSNVETTCSKCHESIDKRLDNSVHANVSSKTLVDPDATSDTSRRKPVCTDCHPGHPLLSPQLSRFRPPIDDSCGNCHAELYSRNARNMHSTLTDRGYSPAAKCSDCHGAHDTLAVNDPQSRVAPGANRLQTCQKCHTHAVSNFTEFDPHANFKNAERYPALHSIYELARYAVNILFIAYLIHAFLWFIRAFVDRLQHGSDSTLVNAKYVLRRFEPMQRTLYVSLLVAFLGLTLTGLALKYGGQSWARWVAYGLGGYRSVGSLHQSFAMFAIIIVIIYVLRAVAGVLKLHRVRAWKSVVFGPESLVPTGRDFRDFYRMLLWFIGFSGKPGFEKWAYWEKLDYWAFFLVAALIGFSGLIIWFPTLFALLLPGGILNIAKILHSEFALYAASVLFFIHFYHAHLRPEKFPMDLSVITGMVSEHHLRTHRPDYIARLECEGKLDELRQLPPSRRHIWLDIVGGLVVFTFGLCLLAVAVLASLEE